MKGIQVNEELLKESEFFSDPARVAELREIFRFDHRRVILGGGATASLGDECQRLGVGRVFLVRDPAVPELAAKVRAALEAGGVEVGGEYDRVVANPTVTSVDELAGVVSEAKCEAVLALGGGSTMDSVKVALCVATSGGSTTDYLGFDMFPEPARWPLIAMPTTSGTGAEASRVAVIVAEQGKQAIYSDYIQPQVALVDPELTTDLPPALTAMTGLDAIGHALECTASRKTNEVGDAVARESLRSGLPHLVQAIARGPSNPEARYHMSRSSLLGGMLLSPINTGAAHALGYGIEKVSHVKGKSVPHGAAVALVLPGVMRHNMPAVAGKYYYTAGVAGIDLGGMTIEEGGREAAAWIDRIRRDRTPFGCLADGGLGEEDLPRMLQIAMDVKRLLDPNPVEVTESDAEAIYREVLS
ncbi:iron-containing alcohol dehydrogenase [Candidatus Latescibacterota bacterium]